MRSLDPHHGLFSLTLAIATLVSFGGTNSAVRAQDGTTKTIDFDVSIFQKELDDVEVQFKKKIEGLEVFKKSLTDLKVPQKELDAVQKMIDDEKADHGLRVKRLTDWKGKAGDIAQKVLKSGEDLKKAKSALARAEDQRKRAEKERDDARRTASDNSAEIEKELRDYARAIGALNQGYLIKPLKGPGGWTAGSYYRNKEDDVEGETEDERIKRLQKEKKRLEDELKKSKQ